MIKHSKEYVSYLSSSAWKKKSRWVNALTRPWWSSKGKRGRCCLLPFLPADQTHHLTYFLIFNLGWNRFGFEQPGWHLVPLSTLAHNFVSQTFFWRQPTRFLVNLYLRTSFIILWTFCKPTVSIPFWFLVLYPLHHYWCLL